MGDAWMNKEITLTVELTYSELDDIVCALYEYAAHLRAPKPASSTRVRALRHRLVLEGLHPAENNRAAIADNLRHRFLAGDPT